MAFRAGLYNFSKGILSDELLGRVDVAAYNAGLKRAENVIILKYGGVTRRPGSLLVSEVHDGTHPVRLVPFQFSLEQTYALEMGQGYMRPAANGGMVLEPELAIIGATQTNPVVVNVAYHDFSAGDDIYITGVAGMVELNGRSFRVVASMDANHFSIDVDGTGFGAFSGNTGGITRVGPPTPPTPPVVPPVVPPPPPPVVYWPGIRWWHP